MSEDEIRPKTFISHLFSMRAIWYWGTCTLVSLAAVVVLLSSADGNVIAVYMRLILGATLVLWFPGYTLGKAVLPWKTLDILERIGLSLALSLAVVAIEGVALNYTTQGVEIVSVTVTLLISTLMFATIAVVREYRFK